VELISTMSATVPSGPTTDLSLSQSNSHEQLGKALGRLASGVFLVTLRYDGQPHGILATWITQAAFEPPMVVAAFNKQRPILQSTTEGTEITINILGKQNTDIFKAFARPAHSAHDNRFSGLRVMDNPNGEGPIFADAAAFLNCRITQVIEAGDHLLALAVVTSGKVLQADAEPMVHVRSSGFHY
jgi:flavin reductase (DIM6/NTAB) family NADH-FMN oxidoreductase RutF